ncbi:MAG: acyltransferase [Aquabacterium sp.]
MHYCSHRRLFLNTRIHYLDGMRGWAALSVLFFHIFWESFGARFPAFRDPVFNFTFHGRLAVYVFFILSGDALISPYLKSKDVGIIQQTSLKRYIRLTVPILLSCLLGFGVMKMGINHNVAASQILHREDWLGMFMQFNASLPDLISQALYGVYFNFSKYDSYNPFLWTMSLEMLGSLMVFIFALQVNTLKKPALTAAAIAGLLFLAKSYYALFFVGICFALLRSSGVFERLQQSGLCMAVSWLLIALVVYSCFRSESIATDGHRTNLLRSIALVGAIHCNPLAITALSSRLSRFLGRVSFPLYLVHFSVLTSLTSYLVVQADKSGLLDASHALGIGLFTIAFCLLAADLFSRAETRLLKFAYKGLGYLQRA